MAISRRRLLQWVVPGAALGVAGKIGLAPVARSLEEAPQAQDGKQKAKRQWAFVVDLRRCDGCKYCTAACQSTHYLPKEQEWIKVYEVEDEAGEKFFLPRLCMHCENPPCLKVCPVAATFKDKEGVVLVDQDRCIGCRLCMAACPYSARYFNFQEPPRPPSPFDNPMPEFPVPQRRGTVGKCILCVHYTDVGRLPACVDACRMGALYIADLNSDVMANTLGETYKLSTYLRENDAFRYKEELNTSPRVWYVAGHGQALEGRNWR
jgi:molybdopterin-containing oxidoreductase family iron-sulfur binding subunit